MTPTTEAMLGSLFLVLLFCVGFAL